MADFCGECAIDTFGYDTRDMAGQTDAGTTEKGEFMAELCEGCGAMILVDHDGVRMTEIEQERRVIDGKECFRWVPRADEEVAAARQRVAQHAKPVERQPQGAQKNAFPEAPESP
eukprot:GHVR01063610.1.p2 GENE.GHVR01063610.1~~GHVR01063610.1.p2  ORF type:complete len:115 (-),score=32.31 GHVR01063610.1:56-400(-)